MNLVGRGKGGLLRTAVTVLVVVGAVGLRYAMFGRESDDYRYFLQPWYQHIKWHGHFGALRDPSFADYNVPYLYLLALLSYLPVPAMAGIKAISLCSDLLLAFFAARIAALRSPANPWRPLLAAVLVLFLPTVAVNSGWWGQADSIYTSFALGGVYYALRRRSWTACALFGLALAFKLQAVFILPLLLVLVPTRRLSVRSLLAIPGVYLLMDVPALLVGADPWKLLTIYQRQTGSYQALTLNAPSVYQFVGVRGRQAEELVRSLGILLAGVVMLLLAAAVLFSRTSGGRRRLRAEEPELTDTRVVLMATVAVVAVPFLLPSMHDRYFYPADVLTVVAFCYLPRRLWFAPLLMQFASLGSYLEYLERHAWHHAPHEQRWFAAAVAVLLVSLLAVTVLEFRRRPPVWADRPDRHRPAWAAPVGAGRR
ncbi:glycosyltransferase 87 family protein [Kitasatospora sp. NPDC006697]|uniref:glycosyltransferase 87 family protein n=1 Tax=Kitasatospora sp. NPDC006697 TaxID=3364020 RepID=UPI0036763952